MDDTGAIVSRARVPTPRTYDGTLDAIEQLVVGLERELSTRGSVGIGIPGAIVPGTGLVKNANSLWLMGQPLSHDLERRLSRDVRVMNDANCFALSEAADGAGAGASVVFGVILGTGVGGGIVVDGRCLDGANLIAGEWGHNPLPWLEPDEFPGPRCYCERRGCIETFLSGPGFESEFRERTGRALASVVNLLDPDVIVLGGGMSNIPDLAETTTARLPRYVFSDTVVTRVVRNVHGDSSGVRGAAWLWPARH